MVEAVDGKAATEYENPDDAAVEKNGRGGFATQGTSILFSIAFPCKYVTDEMQKAIVTLDARKLDEALA